MTQPRWGRALPPIYLLAALRLLLPLLLLPLMAGRLGSDGFGRLSQLLVWAALLAVLLEAGLGLAATRLTVHADVAERRELAERVRSARLLLALLAGLGLLLIQPWLPFSGVQLLLMAWLAAALAGPAGWYLQARGQLHRFAPLEGALLLLMMLAIWAFAGTVESYLLLHALGLSAVSMAGWWRVTRDAGGLARPGWRQAVEGLRLGVPMLPVNLAGAAYTLALPAMAATQLQPAQLGLFYMADRIVRALAAGVDPLWQLLYPRIVARFAQGPRQALRLAGCWSLAALAAAFAILCLGLLLWPLLAPAFPAALPAAALKPVLMLLALLLPLQWALRPLGFWMLASRRLDTAYRLCMVGGALAGIGLLCGLAPLHAAVDLAWVALAAEGIVSLLAVCVVVWSLRWVSTSTT